MESLFSTCDLVDQYSELIQVVDFIGLTHFGAIRQFKGVISTISCFEDNSLLKKTVSQSGEGKILVVDGGGSKRCALIGDIIAGIALENKWAGIIINGCVRDSMALAKLQIGVMALGTNPQRSAKANKGVIDGTVSFGGVSFEPGCYIYADTDGIVVSPKSLKFDTITV